MNIRFATWGLVVALVGSVSGTATYGVTRDLVAVTTGNWRNNTAVWKLASAQGGGDPYVVQPDSDDNATILTGVEITVDSKATSIAEALTLTVNNSNSAVLSMEDDGELRLENSLTVSGSGVFQFRAGVGETRPILRSAGSLEINGHIQIVDAAGAEIAKLTTETVKFNSGSLVDSAGGDLVISANLENAGRIEAKGGFDVNISGEIDDDSAGHFMATAANSDMTFNHTTAVVIDGGADFQLTGGSMAFNQSVQTNGGYQQTGGTVQVAATKTYTATGAFVAP